MAKAKKTAKKRAPTKCTATVPRPGHVLVLRTCDAQMRGHGGFVWPPSGPVRAPDWDPAPRCGGGLHGLLWGEGGDYVNWDADARWLVVEVRADEIVDLDDKVKFPRGRVVHCGDRLSATSYLAERAPGRAIVGGTATAGDGGTATAGDRGTATAGVGGALMILWWDGNRYRIATLYVGEGGIEPNVAYRVDDKGTPYRADGQPMPGARVA